VIQVHVHPEEIDPAWLEKAQKLAQLLTECKDDADGLTAAEKRRAIIDANADHWRELRLKETLLRWSHNKCWYSELKDVGSDYHVDHYRPKGRVRNEGEEGREGYWWLAFAWTNYRIAVAWVNSPHRETGKASQGKADQFPLKPGTLPLKPGDDPDKETPLILDPTRLSDIRLVDYDENGLPVPTVGGWGADRVLGTRRILHLDSQRMIDERNRIWRECTRRLQRAAEALSPSADEHSAYHDKSADDWIKEVCEMLRPDQELSSVARACVAKSEYVWARHLLAHPWAELQDVPAAASDAT
jgi:hypothetical protein